MLSRLPRGSASAPSKLGSSEPTVSRPGGRRSEGRRKHASVTRTTTTTLATSALHRSSLPLSPLPRSTPRSASADSPTCSSPATRSVVRGRTPRGRNSTESVAVAASAAADGSPPPSSPSDLDQDAEASRYCYEDLVLFLLSVDCDVQLNRALAKDDFEFAAAVRERRGQIDEALEALRTARDLLPTRGGVGSTPASTSSSPAVSEVDAALQGVRLRSELASAIEAENYALASQLRDKIKGVEEQLAAAAGAAAVRAERAGAPPRLRLGARVLHRVLGYRGAIAGWDSCCLETPEWQARAGISDSDVGAFQPFYHVLVDARDWRGPEDSPPLLYVPESRLSWPEGSSEIWLNWTRLDSELAARKSTSGSSNSSFLYEGVDDRELLHPYSYLLFLGTDERGDMIPTKALRERYGAPRVDVYPPASSEGEAARSEDDD